MAVVGNRLFVADQSFDRVLMFEDAPPVGGIVELQTDSEAQSERLASSSPLPIVALVALGALALGAGGLYVVRLRRG